MGETTINNYNFTNERDVEKFVGIEIFSTSELSGIGGIYKNSHKDFIVKEITHSGEILPIKDYPNNQNYNSSNKYYTSFNLVKVNKDTFEAVRLISKALNIPVDSIKYSGLKDKCAISVQRASIKGNYISELAKLNIRDIFIRNIKITKNPVKLGSNWGNNFTITIRNVTKDTVHKQYIEKLLCSINSKGIPNYYGLQRFGTFRPNSHLVGRYILENNFQSAIEELLLTSYSTELEVSRTVRESLRNSGDFKEAYNAFPKSLNYERTLIKYFIRHPEDYKGALGELPQYLIKIIISSFQSFLFNKMLSLRFNMGYSLFEPVAGDVISILDDSNGQITQTKYIYGNRYDSFLEEAIRLNHASIVIPLIGYDTNLDDFPLAKSLLLTILSQEKIDLNIFENELLTKHEFKGSFRSILVKPDALRLIDVENDEVFPNQYKIKIEFSLPKGSYATMLLREVIKS